MREQTPAGPVTTATSDRLRAWARVISKGPRLRTRAFIPLAVLLLWLAWRGPLNWWGIGLALAGEALRLLASAYLHKGGEEVTSTGPYAFCRNPLYLGTGLMITGMTVAVRAWWLAAAVALVFIAFHLITIAYEESRLTERYGEPYREYCRHVPRLVPRMLPWRDASGPGFSLARIVANREHWRALGVLAFVAATAAVSLLGAR